MGHATAQTLAFEALARERQESHVRYNEHISGKPELRSQRMIVVDRNNSLKRIKAIGNRQVGDKRTFELDYFLSPEFVDQYADEVKAWPALPTHSNNIEADEPDNEGVISLEGDPTDSSFNSGPSGCTDNWKAAAKDENKKMWAIFSEAGIFASACRHSFILWIADMIASGELAKYPVAIVAKALQIFKSRFLLGYDIGCKFGTMILGSSLGPQFKASGSRCCVNAFHGYSHHYLCQLFNHPNTIEGMGIEDLETLERVFSASNSLGAVTCYMTAYQRRVFIDLHFRHWDSEKYANIANMLHQNYRQALTIIKDHTFDIQHVLDLRQLDEPTLLTYIDDKRSFFSALGKEPDDDLHAIAYAELLEELWGVEQTAEYMANRKYEHALDTLQSLVVKRLFELHKLNLSQTAVACHNTLAIPLGRPTLDWTKVTHYTFLNEFNILRHTRTDINKKPWADPVIHETMQKYQQLQHAKEEIIRCNIELHCLHGFTGDLTPGVPLNPLPPLNLDLEPSSTDATPSIQDTGLAAGDNGISGRVTSALTDAPLKDHEMGEVNNGQATALEDPPSGDSEEPACPDFHDSGTLSDPESGDEFADDEIGDIRGLVDFISHLS
ncbi:hypothetical protein DXG01_000627 [Tephrocybe rancida]|nr:hypothetical protein DXG01_000627 [Tephrocybe rancida]